MLILSHRGLWRLDTEKNSLNSFHKSFQLNLGIELDIRDHNGDIVVSHDMPYFNKQTFLFEDVLKLSSINNHLLAINIKSDGLSDQLEALLKKYNHTNYFVFDMSIPEMYKYINKKLKTFTHLSDICPQAILSKESSGIWLDSFMSEWYNSQLIDNILNAEPDKKVCIVSAELHKRDHIKQWNIIKQSNMLSSDRIMLCTDLPTQAMEFFK